MAQVAFILAQDDMLDAARKMAAQYQLDVVMYTAINNSNTLEKVEQAVAAGAEIIISRGGQARIARDAVTIPVVEIRLTVQEVGVLILQAKRLAGGSCPVVALVGPDNMFCDLPEEQLRELYGAIFRYYPFHTPEEMAAQAGRAIDEGAQVLIGGRESCGRAAQRGIPAVRTESGAESLAEACRVAQHVSYAVDAEKKNTANFRAILNYVQSGVIQVNETGMVQHINQFVERLLGKTEQDVQGVAVWKLIPGLSEKLLRPVLEEGKEIYSTRVTLRRMEFMTGAVPVLLSKRIAGAIISIHEGMQIELFTSQRRTVLRQEGHTAHFTFDGLICRSPAMKELIAQAKKYSQLDCSVLIQGETGSEFTELAECIHTEGPFSEQAFVSVQCDGYPPDELERLLFGETGEGDTHIPGLIEKAEGILCLYQISALSLAAQYRLYRALSRRASHSYQKADLHAALIRVIATDSRDLLSLVRNGEFREDLYYRMSIARLYLPPLRERREDIGGWVEFFIKFYQKQYGRFLHLTKDAVRMLEDYTWPGNVTELRNVCHRLVASSPRRTVDANFAATQIDPPQIAPALASSAPAFSSDPQLQKAHLQSVLMKHGGNRTASARELGISTSTLWRRMKKWGI